MNIEDLKLAVSRIHILDGTGATKAFADIGICDALIIKGFTVVEGKDGLFVMMPRESGKDGKWYSVVVPLSREVKDEVERIVLEAYDQTTPNKD